MSQFPRADIIKILVKTKVSQRTSVLTSDTCTSWVRVCPRPLHCGRLMKKEISRGSLQRWVVLAGIFSRRTSECGRRRYPVSTGHCGKGSVGWKRGGMIWRGEHNGRRSARAEAPRRRRQKQNLTRQQETKPKQFLFSHGLCVTWDNAPCAQNKMLFGTRKNKWCNLISTSRRERQIWAYSKNVNLPFLGQGNLPSNRSQLLSSEGRRRKRGKDIWHQQLCGLYPRAADSVTPRPLWHGAAALHKTSYTIFPSLGSKSPCNLPTLLQQIGLSRSLARDAGVADVMWKALLWRVNYLGGPGWHSGAHGHNSIKAMWIRWWPRSPPQPAAQAGTQRSLHWQCTRQQKAAWLFLFIMIGTATIQLWMAAEDVCVCECMTIIFWSPVILRYI